MAKQKYLLVAACCFLAVLSGCSYWIQIIVTGDDSFHPEFVLRKPLMSAPRGRTPKLRYFRICDESGIDWNCQDPIWNFWLAQEQLKYVGKVQYGIVPDGFEEEAPSKPLTPGVTYRVAVGASGGIGSVRFRIVEKDGSYELQVLEKEESVSQSFEAGTAEGE
jgi:hypothetical protein